MNFHPAGDSSDEDDGDFELYSSNDNYMTENERKEQTARNFYNEKQQIENLPITRIYNAVVAGNLEQVKKELDDNFNIETKVYNQLTLLHLAASLGKYDIIVELLLRGANAKVEDEGFTVLMAVCTCPKRTTTPENITNIINKLLEYDVDVDEVDRKRRTAFMLACEQGFIEVVKLLQPLSNLEAEDNRGWTALFYAVEAKNLDVFKYLHELGANYNHTDIRNNTIKYYAFANEFYEILKILPNDDLITDDLIQNEYNYEEMFEYLENNFRPTFKEDLALLLYGMKCENLITLFNDDDMDLNTFLTLDNDELEMFGVNMSFQRQRILQGLYRFHQNSWKKTSIPFIPRNGTYTTTDLFAIVTTAVKHIVIMEATLDYLEKNYDFYHIDAFATKLNAIQKKIRSMKAVVKHLNERSKKFDKIGFNSDTITKEFSFKKNNLNKKIALGLVGMSTLFIIGYCKMKYFSN